MKRRLRRKSSQASEKYIMTVVFNPEQSVGSRSAVNRMRVSSDSGRHAVLGASSEVGPDSLRLRGGLVSISHGRSTKKRRWLNVLSRPCNSLVETEWRNKVLNISYPCLTDSLHDFIINKRDYIFISKRCCHSLLCYATRGKMGHILLEYDLL